MKSWWGDKATADNNFGFDYLPKLDRRYSWTSEFIEVVRGLWDTWEDDALVADKGTGQFIDEAKVHRLNYRGRHFSVNGPINIARPPQGHVPMLHAGSSEESHEFGARYAESGFRSSDPFRCRLACTGLQRMIGRQARIYRRAQLIRSGAGCRRRGCRLGRELDLIKTECHGRG